LETVGKFTKYLILKDLYYTSEHTWARVLSDGTVEVGITDFAQRSLREIVFVKLPDIGSELKQMEPFGSVESVKAVSDLCSPISGKVVERNTRITENPNLINRDPYGAGWMIKIKPENLEELRNLMHGDRAVEWLKEEVIKKAKEPI
jgi:glycine cleavage system H protein